MGRNGHAKLRGTVLVLLAGLVVATSSCQTTTPPPPAYDHFTIVNEGPVPIHDVRFLVADATGAIFDETVLRGGAPIHPGEAVTWVRPHGPGMPRLEQVRCELVYDGPEGPTELSATAPIDPMAASATVDFHFRERPDQPGEFELVVE